MNLNKSLIVTVATILVRSVLGAIFIYASLDKIADPTAFAKIITNYQVLPQLWVSATAVFLPWVEVTCGLALVFGRFEKGAAMLIILMMAVFIGIHFYNGYRGLDIACGCFSLSTKEPSNIAMNAVRNLTLLTAGIWVLFYTKLRQSEPA